VIWPRPHLDLGACDWPTVYDLPWRAAETSEAVRLAPQSGVVPFLSRPGSVRPGSPHDRKRSLSSKLPASCFQQCPNRNYYLALIDKQEGKFPLAAGLLGRDGEAAASQRDGLVFCWASAMNSSPETDKGGRGVAAGHRS